VALLEERLTRKVKRSVQERIQHRRNKWKKYQESYLPPKQPLVGIFYLRYG